MVGELVRTQVLLGKEQQRRLAELAAAQGKSVSALLRQAVDTLLQAEEEEQQRQTGLEALEGLRRIQQQLLEEHGVYYGDPLGDVRAEREAQWDEFFRQEGLDCPSE